MSRWPHRGMLRLATEPELATAAGLTRFQQVATGTVYNESGYLWSDPAN